MAIYIGKTGLSTNLASTPIENGFLLSTDDGALYLDYNESDTKKRFNIVPKKSDSVKNVTLESGAIIKVTTQDGNSEYYSIPTMGAASSSNAGTKGLVPAPAAGDQNKYLRGDNTWAEVAAPSYDTGNEATAGIVKLYTGTGSNTDGSMTQNAITTAINNLQSAIDTIQEKLNALAIADISGLQDALDGKAASTHTHAIADVTNLQNTLDGKLSTTGTAAAANKLATARTITLGSDCSGSVSFDGSANVTLNVTVKDDSHNHTIANVDNLQSQLNTISSKASSAKSVTDKYSAMLNIIGNNQ